MHVILKYILIYVSLKCVLKMSSSSSKEIGCTEKTWEDV